MPVSPRRKFALVLAIGCLCGSFVADLPATASVDITIDRSAKVMVLYGYSMDLNRQQPTPIHPLLNALLPPFVSILKGRLTPNIDYVSDSILDVRLASAGIEEGERPVAIAKLLEREHYTHLVVAAVTMINNSKGVVLMQVVRLNAGKPQDVDVTGGTKLLESSQSNDSLDVIRNEMAAEFVRKFQREGTKGERTIHINCIMPVSSAILQRLDELERNQVDLEIEVSRLVTPALIRWYQNQKTYKTTVDEYFYDFVVNDKGGVTCTDGIRRQSQQQAGRLRNQGQISVAPETSTRLLLRVPRCRALCARPLQQDHNHTEGVSAHRVYDKREFSVRFRNGAAEAIRAGMAGIRKPALPGRLTGGLDEIAEAPGAARRLCSWVPP